MNKHFNDKAGISRRRNSSIITKLGMTVEAKPNTEPDKAFVSEALEYREYEYTNARGDIIYKGMSSMQPQLKTVKREPVKPCIAPVKELSVKVVRKASITPNVSICQRCDDNSKRLQYEQPKQRFQLPCEVRAIDNPSDILLAICARHEAQHKRLTTMIAATSAIEFKYERKPKTSTLDERLDSFVKEQSKRKAFSLCVNLKYLVTASLRTGR